MNRIGAVGLLLLSIAACGAGAGDKPAAGGHFAIRYAGSLGQSQPDDCQPLKFTEPGSAVSTKDGCLWLSYGKTLCQIRNPGAVRAEPAEYALKDNVRVLEYDNRVYLWNGWQLSQVDVSKGTAEEHPVFKCDFAELLVAAAPSCKTGFATNAAFLVMNNRRQVFGFSADGRPTGQLAQLPKPTRSAMYNGMAVEAKMGDLIVSVGYPENAIRRFRPDGIEVLTAFWPRLDCAIYQLYSSSGRIWSVCSEAVEVHDTPFESVRIPTTDSFFPKGVALDYAGGYWIASDQGICRYRASTQPYHQRLGGILPLNALTALPDGQLLAGASGSNRILRLWADDAANAPLSCNSNEPWRLGGGWSGEVAQMAGRSQVCVILDARKKELWAMTMPQGELQTPAWEKIATPAELSEPLPPASAIGRSETGTRSKLLIKWKTGHHFTVSCEI